MREARVSLRVDDELSDQVHGYLEGRAHGRCLFPAPACENSAQSGTGAEH